MGCFENRLLLLVVVAACHARIDDDIVPPEPNAGATTSTDTSTFAIDSLFLGDSDRSGHEDYGAWKSYGYDLDGKITTETSTDVCHPVFPYIQADADGGVDNSWGANLVVLVETGLATPTFSNDATSFVQAGVWTLLVEVKGLSDDPGQTATGLEARVAVGATTDAGPAFDPTTDWPMRPSSLDANGAPLVAFKTVYVTNGKLVARDATAPLVLPVTLWIHDTTPLDAGGPKPPRPTVLTLRIHHPVLTFDHVDGSTAANGIIAGVLDTAESLAAERVLSGNLSPSYCGTFDNWITEAQDILADGTNAPGGPCNAISIGLGFSAKRVANPTTIGTDPPPPIDPCSDAGAAD